MRFIVPGDYVVHEKYGIGKYTGMHQVNIAPLDAKVCNVPAVTVKYLDGEVTWFQRFAEKELWMYRTADSEGVSMQLSSLLDNRKWVKRKKVVEEKSKRYCT
jgi:transcription-repair coupling factor (superfamily II helicase)